MTTQADKVPSKIWISPVMVCGPKREMMPAKISRETPLPIPFSVMRSPIHMASAVPPARQMPMVI